MLTVDEVTGEVVEKEDANAVATRVLTEQGIVTQAMYDLIENYLTAKEQYETFKFVLHKAMKENSIKSWKNDVFSSTIKDEAIQTRVDTKALEDTTLERFIDKVKTRMLDMTEEERRNYLNKPMKDFFQVLVPVKESLQIRFKETK